MAATPWLSWSAETPITSVDQVGFDEEYEDKHIQSVNDESKKYFDITLDDGWSISIEKALAPFRPKAGDDIRLYGEGIGRPVRGIAINGYMVRYESQEENDLGLKLSLAQARRNDQVNNWAKREEIAERIQALPFILRERMHKFEEEEPGFLLTSGATYELFIYEEAVKFATTLKTIEELDKWKQLDYNEQKLHVNVGEGHSGNTFGAACAFAKWLLEEDAVKV